MDNKIDNKITEKIQQLLSMAEHPNSNEYEAAIALEKAQELLFKHNLTRADVNTEDVTTPAGIGKISKTEDSGYTWKRGLIAVLASANLCKVIGSPSEKTWHLFGSYDNVKSVLEMFNWITTQLVFMANRDFRAYKNDEGTERGQTWKHGYYLGAIGTIRERLNKPLEAFSQGDGKSLVIKNKVEVSNAVNKVFPHVTQRRGSYTRSNDGFTSGRNAANGMTLTPSKRLAGRHLLS